jgi:hypothetical protein
MLICFHAKARGASHEESGAPCQDAAFAFLGPRKTNGMALVADGHGSEKHFRSDKGSALAVNAAEKAVEEFFAAIKKEQSAFFNKKGNVMRDKEIDAKLKQLEGNVIYSWREAVQKDIGENPLSDGEKELCVKHNIDFADDANLFTLYGTTLLTAFVTANFWFALQIGDGLCVTLDAEGGAAFPIPEDERLAFGRTTSLCDYRAIENFRHAFGFEAIKGISVATDGVADSFESEKYLAFNRKLYDEFIRDGESASKDLSAFLPKLSADGSRDDCAIAGVWKIEEENKINGGQYVSE